MRKQLLTNAKINIGRASEIFIHPLPTHVTSVAKPSQHFIQRRRYGLCVFRMKYKVLPFHQGVKASPKAVLPQTKAFKYIDHE